MQKYTSVRGGVSKEWTALAEAGVITPEQLRTAFDSSGGRNAEVGNHLVSLGFVTEREMARGRARTLGLRYETPEPADIPPEVLDTVPERVQRRHTVLPLRIEGEKLVTATNDPSNIYATEDLHSLSGYEVSYVLATRSDILAALDTLFGGAEAKVRARVDAGEPDAVKLFGGLLERAVSEGASDIHLEPSPEGLSVRMRIDGTLRDVESIPEVMRSGVVTRAKVLANLDIAERRVPQDGRFTADTDSGSVDLRVASLPTVFGEGLVLRVLDPSRVDLDFERLGFSGAGYDTYRESYSRKHGAVLVTGPTGSGKSTTLYATLVELNEPEKKVITIEDPVEYRLAGLSQIQTNPRAGVTFASGLRSILRADPDVVMIGEIRDSETARTAVEASLTGHLVLATLHTNDAPSALTRLADMGVEPYLVASAIDCVVAQRLARRLCDLCKRPVTVSEAALREVGFPFDLTGSRDFHEAAGCEDCGGTGYRGRTGIFEVMSLDTGIRELVLEKASSSRLAVRAREAGMVPLRHDGLVKAAEGVTSVEEVLRTVL